MRKNKYRKAILVGITFAILSAAMMIPSYAAEEDVCDQMRKVSFQVIVKAEEERMLAPIPVPSYEDVSEIDWFYDAVVFTYYRGIMRGMDETHFGPYEQLSRAQFALILHRMRREEKVETDKTFDDIAGDEWYGAAVLWAAENGIVTGYQDGNFGPADMITREQMAVMMYRYAKYLGIAEATAGGDYSSFSDAANVSGFAAEAMAWAVGNGIITGKGGETKIDPQGNTARSEAAVILQRFDDVRDHFIDLDFRTGIDKIFPNKNDMTYLGAVVINAEPEGGTHIFSNCTFTENVYINAVGGNVIVFDEECVFENGAEVILITEEKEATIDTVLPRVVTYVPVNVTVKNMGMVISSKQDTMIYNDVEVQIEDCELVWANDGNSYREINKNTKYNGLGISQWWENGEKIVLQFALRFTTDWQ